MLLVTKSNVKKYLKNDVTAKQLSIISTPDDENLTCQKWLKQSEAKRFVFHNIYGDILKKSGLRILDIGGGLTSFTRQLASLHDYVLVDMLAHDDEKIANKFNQEAKKDFIHICDWYDFENDKPFDIIIANDLFPNVDQRLEIFLDRYLPQAKEIHLSLTYYNEPRFYKTKRLNADEYLCMLAWNAKMLSNSLQNYKNHIIDENIGLLKEKNDSVYANNRQVCIIKMKAQHDQ